MNGRTHIKVGEFQATGKLVVSDPCYSLGKGKKSRRYQALIKRCRKGTWNAFVGTGESDADYLLAHHVDAPALADMLRMNITSTLGVDSGQMSIVSKRHYRGGMDDYEDVDGWYRSICNLTLSGDNGGVFEGGCASRTAYGDGGYNGYIYAGGIGGEIQAIVVWFVDFECRECGRPIDLNRLGGCPCEYGCPTCGAECDCED